jgi:hypothetical protein
MTQPTLAGVAGQIAAPVVAALLEDLHAAASAEITRLEAAAPARITAAEQDVQNWANDLKTTLHGLVARIEGARANLTAATQPGPTAAETTSSTDASAPTTAPTTTPTAPQDATTKAAK